MIKSKHSGCQRLGSWYSILSAFCALYLSASTRAQYIPCAQGWHLVSTNQSPNAPDPGRPLTVYDSRRHVAVLFSGTDDINVPAEASETWEWNGAAWALRINFWNALTNPPPFPIPPFPRSGGAMAYDESRGVCVLFGGKSRSEYLNDTWEWDGSAWSPLNDTSGTVPPPMTLPLMAYDSARKRIVLFDSYDPGTWEWDGTNWSNPSVSGPPSRTGTTMAYDPIRRVTVLFGGESYPGNIRLNDTWTWDGTTWNLVHSGGPPARDGHAMVFDSRRKVIVVFGGSIGSSGSVGYCKQANDLWEWNGQSWSLQAYSTAVDDPAVTPRKRRFANMWYDTTEQKLVVYRGQWGTTNSLGNCGIFALDDMWEAPSPGLWVDFSYAGAGTGELDAPFNTLAEAVDVASAGCTINLKTGSRAEAITITKQLQLEAPYGPVTIGP
jgi:hypothetical protein